MSCRNETKPTLNDYKNMLELECSRYEAGSVHIAPQ